MITAAALGLCRCDCCSLLARLPAGGGGCPRCGAPLHARKPQALARTWALLIAAAILLGPANLLPIMETRSPFGNSSDTIMSGVLFLWSSGSWLLAAVVFFASIMVPLLKLMALLVLAATAQRRTVWRPHQRARLYRLTEFVGRWSMLDIFVVTVLVALVQVQSLMTISAGPGAIAFGAVVVLTMFAAHGFDPRLIWDPLSERHLASDDLD
jgi:paraquat-inducible protein A